MNFETRSCSSFDRFLSSLPDSSVLIELSAVSFTMPSTAAIFCVISCVACADSLTLAFTPELTVAHSWMFLEISLVAIDCSSTEDANVFETWLTLEITSRISLAASIESLVEVWIAFILSEISSVACAVWLASCLTSVATTANPLPASPARAASMVAFSARRFVCSAMS